jgi:predicted dithiol-disulfide oxidoreductase (DUF899 family)
VGAYVLNALSGIDVALDNATHLNGYLVDIAFARERDEAAYWTTSRGVEYMDNSYRLLDLTVYGRQERFEDSPAGWPQPPEGTDTMRADWRPLAQWQRLKAGYSDDLGTGTR